VARPFSAPVEDGPRRTTVSQFVVKVHGRCDLACDHCYVYEHADQSWRRKPRSMSHATAVQAARRIAEHAHRHSVAQTHVIVHGGEPLLLGLEALDRLLGALRSEIGPVTRLDLRLHTNAVRLSEEFCGVFERHSVRVGVSLDGDRAANDRHRNFADGRSSHRQTLDGLSLLRRPEFRRLYAGILCTIDIRNDPISVYEALVEQQPPRLDFLLPHATWERPPLRTGASPTEYADWLAAIHTRWQDDGQPVPIRVFEALAATADGRPSGSEAIGTDPVDLVVIETDGTYEQADSLKTAYDGAPTTGFNVFDHSVDEAASHPALTARRTGANGLSGTCRKCPVVQSCGGGLYAHRYSAENGFDNPSVYCDDLKALIQRQRERSAGSRARTTGRRPLPQLLEELAQVPGTASPLHALAAARQSDDRALVAAAARKLGLVNPPAAGWELLVSLDQTAPREVAAVLAHPYVRAWAVRCLEGPAGEDQIAERSYISASALSSAIRAGVSATVTVTAQRGAIHLPTLGALLVGDSSAVTIKAAAGRLSFTANGREHRLRLPPPPSGSALWQPTRRLRASGIVATLEDGDGYRDCYQHPVTDRISAEEAATWQHRFSQAMAFLNEHLPDYLPPLRAGLQCVTPLRPDPEGGYVSGTARHAPGTVAVALPDDPEVLALLVVHEFQHVKLWAALSRFDLVDAADRSRYRVGWRDDPRPAEGVLHGVYAHLAVADFWKAQRDRLDRAPRPHAASHHARWSRDVDRAIGTLSDSNALTALGADFISRLADLRRRPPGPPGEPPKNGLATDTECL
jgi:uncharacterized protein